MGNEDVNSQKYSAMLKMIGKICHLISTCGPVLCHGLGSPLGKLWTSVPPLLVAMALHQVIIIKVILHGRCCGIPLKQISSEDKQALPSSVYKVQVKSGTLQARERVDFIDIGFCSSCKGRRHTVVKRSGYTQTSSTIYKYFRLVLCHFFTFFHTGFRFERPQYYAREHDGTLQMCTTYKGANVPQSLEVKANLRPTGKPRISTLLHTS